MFLFQEKVWTSSENFIPFGMDILRELYPFLKEHNTVEHYKMLDICQNQFDTFQISDEFSMLAYISEEDLLMIIFLDNLSNHFLKNSNYYITSNEFYITSNELNELYDISCESLEYEKNFNELISIINKIQRVGILSPSKKFNNDNTSITDNSIECNSFFMIINPYQLKVMVDTVFGKI